MMQGECQEPASLSTRQHRGHCSPSPEPIFPGGPTPQSDNGAAPFPATWGTWAQGTLCPFLKTYWLSLPSDFQDDMTDSLRDYTNLPEAAPLLTILDMSARAKYVMDVEEITPAIVEAFVNDFLAEKLKPEPI